MSVVLEKSNAKKELAPYDEAVTLVRDPLRMFDWMRNEMDRMFEAAPFGRLSPMGRFDAPWMPTVEVFEKNGAFHIKTDLPGIKKEDVTIEATAEGITIKGERKREFKEEKKDEGYFRTERLYGRFSRFVPLPADAAIDKMTATFKDGVLEVVTPVATHEKLTPKKVEIK